VTALRVGSLCTGYGGLDMAAQAVFGGELAWWADIDPGPIAVMGRHHPGVPNLGDLKAIDWSAVERVDLLTAGYPCQPFSNAGKRLGTQDPRHLWPYVAKAVGALRPLCVVLENVAAHLRRGFDVVLQDLAEIGYDATWAVVRASDVGAPHRRERLFVVASDARGQALGLRTGLRPGQPAGLWRGRPDHDSAPSPAADTFGEPVRDQPRWGGWPIGSSAAEPGHAGQAVADAGSIGRDGWADSERAGRHETVGSETGDHAGDGAVSWGAYAPAVERWERITGRRTPEPTETGARGARVLSPRFVEWLMGLPAGHVTDTEGLTRNAQLKLLGNGVVPQQAEHVLRELLASIAWVAGRTAA
jgi:DNA (cytosine-5)-methyltransferase 1